MSYTFKSKNGVEYTVLDEFLYKTPEPEKSKPDVFTIIAAHSGLVSANNIINSLNKENYKIVDTDTHNIVDKRQPASNSGNSEDWYYAYIHKSLKISSDHPIHEINLKKLLVACHAFLFCEHNGLPHKRDQNIKDLKNCLDEL